MLTAERILLTGATGFVGRAVVAQAGARALNVRECVRTAASLPPPGRDGAVVGELDGETDWSHVLPGCTTVLHLAARVHVLDEQATDPLTAFRRVNVAGTRQLARQAAAAGVRRFVFVSSIKVNGEATPPGRPFTVSDPPAPLDAYGISKMEAEQALREVSEETGMEAVIVRPPLVYGPGVRANFGSLMRWLAKGRPLPLGAVNTNARSLVAVDNLVDLLLHCLQHPAAANQTFLVSDGEDLSTTALLQRLGAALGKPARLLPVPPPLLDLGARLIGRTAVAQRLLGSLQVDIEHTRTKLEWLPPIGVDEALRRAAAGVTLP